MTQAQTTALQDRLQSLMGRIQRREDISEDLAALDRLQTEVADTAPVQLRHFLENRSYGKALEYLASGAVREDPNRPDCDA